MPPATKNTMCANHQAAQEVTEKNDAGEEGEFWLFGYGYILRNGHDWSYNAY